MCKTGKCAKCSNEDITYTNSEMPKFVNSENGTQLIYTYWCSKCGCEGQEVYNLEFAYNKITRTKQQIIDADREGMTEAQIAVEETRDRIEARKKR